MPRGPRAAHAGWVRIAELSQRSGVSVPTIKFYLREGLLPSGTPTGRNQARYDEAHERRLRLLRALVEVGGLSTAALQQVLRAVDAPVASVPALLGRARRSTTAETDAEDPLRDWADAAVAQLAERHGWRVDSEDPAARALAHVLVTAVRLGHQDILATVDTYAVVCEDIAAAEMRSLTALPTTAEVVEGMVLGAVLGDAAIAALRRLAQDAVARRVFG